MTCSCSCHSTGEPHTADGSSIQALRRWRCCAAAIVRLTPDAERALEHARREDAARKREARARARAQLPRCDHCGQTLPPRSPDAADVRSSIELRTLPASEDLVSGRSPRPATAASSTDGANVRGAPCLACDGTGQLATGDAARPFASCGYCRSIGNGL